MKIAKTSARTQKRYMPDTAAPMMSPARARPAPASIRGVLLMRRTADTPTQKAAGPSRIPNGQTSTTAAIPRIRAKAARASVTGGAVAAGASIAAAGPTLVRHIAFPRPTVAAAAAAPTTSKATNAAGPGRCVPQIKANAIDANRSAPSTTPPATKSAPVTVTAGSLCSNEPCRESLSHYDRLSQELRTGESQRLAAYASGNKSTPPIGITTK